MSRTVLAFATTAFLVSTALAGSGEVGFRQIRIDDPARPLQVSLWYPAAGNGSPQTVGENRAFEGIQAFQDAAPLSGSRPLVVLSHGYGGSWRNLSWLAGRLVAEGYVVAAPDHPGTTTFDRSPAKAAEIWQRPRDLSRVIDALSGDETQAGAVDTSRIAAIGHSLGGWTVTALAGARFDHRQFASDCAAAYSKRTCGLTRQLGLDTPEVDQPMGDPRVRAFVSLDLDLGLARGFTPESLASLEVRALVFGAGVDIGDLPARLESGYLAEHLPPATSVYVEIEDAAHFSFMQLCKPGAAELIEQEDPGDGIVCKDGNGRSRAVLHDEIAGRVISFLKAALAGG